MRGFYELFILCYILHTDFTDNAIHIKQIGMITMDQLYWKVEPFACYDKQQGLCMRDTSHSDQRHLMIVSHQKTQDEQMIEWQ
jgi:hypothetical protein